MMKTEIFLLRSLAVSAVFLSACTGIPTIGTNTPPVVAPDNESWKSAPMQYKCNTKQNKKVETETSFCTGNTSLSSAYCYSAAIIRNCTEKLVK
jgi:hypothetical protein